MEQDFEPDRALVRRPLLAVGIIALSCVVFAVIGYWAYQRDAGSRSLFGPTTGASPQAVADTVGTTGAAEPRPVASAGSPVEATPGVIQEIETITGIVDGQELIGRRIDLHVKVQAVPNNVVFWIGENDNRVLVALGRDTRHGSERQRGLPPRHGILPVHPGQYAAISGTVQRLPRAEEMFNWQLTENELAEAKDRKVYILADNVTANGHGTH